MVYLRQKLKGGRSYYELVESKRIDGKVRQKVLKYFGSIEEANVYAKKHGLKLLPEGGLIDPALSALLERKLVKLTSLRPLPEASVKSLKDKIAVEMTYNSNAIEGNSLSLQETKLVIMDGITVGGHPLREIFEAKNHKEALDLLYRMAEGRKPVSEEDVLELHAVITHDTLPPGQSGFYRVSQVWITGSKHKPPDWHDAPLIMREKVYPELNSKAKGAAAVESAAKVHYWTVHAHPFADGNGRLARLLMNFRLMRAGFPPAIVLMMDRMRYYAGIRKADEGDLKLFASLVARTVLRALDLWLSAAE